MAGRVQAKPPEGGTLVSQEAPQPVGTANLPNIDPESDFIFFAHPGRWVPMTWPDGTEELLPLLSKMKLDPGLNGITETGNADLARAARMRKGQIEIPRNYGPDDYVKLLPVRRGKLYHERWRQFVSNGASVVERHNDENRIEFLTWLRGVAATLPELLPEILEGQQEIYRAKLLRQIDAAAGNPLKAINVERTEEKIEALEAFKQGAKTIPAKPSAKGLLAKARSLAGSSKKVEATDAKE